MLIRFKLNSLDPFDMDVIGIETEESNSAIIPDLLGDGLPLVSTGSNNTFYLTSLSEVFRIVLDDSQPERLWQTPDNVE